MLVQMLVSKRMALAGRSHVRSLHDGTNAFASTTRESLERFADHDLLDQDKPLMQSRRANSHIWLDTPTGFTVVVPHCGALMGDSCAPQDFSKAYQPGVEVATKA